MKLLIDAGNTRTKWRWVDTSVASQAGPVQRFDNADWFAQRQSTAIDQFRQSVQSASAIWISLVAGDAWRQTFALLPTQAVIHRLVAPASAAGLHNRYQQPAQLGVDRWCSALAIWRGYQQAALVVSAGTALTIDGVRPCHVSDRGEFLGGSIQPGLQLMWQSLQQGAAQLEHHLPTGMTHAPVPLFAQDSQQAMWQGCLHAMAGAIALQYARFARTCETAPLLVLTGGDAALLLDRLPDVPAGKIVYAEDLVLQGVAVMAESVNQ